MEGDQQLPESISNVFRGDGFVIENCIVKGDEILYPIKYNSVAELILETLNQNPEHIAQIDSLTGKKQTYEELKERTIRLAVWLKKQNIGIGDIVSICSPSHLDIESIMFACIFIGATYNTFPHDLQSQPAKVYMNHIKPLVMFACKSKIGILREAIEWSNHSCKMIALYEDSNETTFDDILKTSSDDEIKNFQITTDTNKEIISRIQPTSGTTGVPKFACFSYENLSRYISMHVDSSTRYTNKFNLMYLYPEWAVHYQLSIRHFLTGVTQVFHQNFETHETCKIIEKYKVTNLIFCTYLAAILCHSDISDKYDLSSVTLIIPLGTVLSATIDKKLRSYFKNALIGKIYGMTETQDLTDCLRKCRNPESQGMVIPNSQLKIVDLKTGLALGHNQPGEIRVKNPCIMTFYYKDPDTTEKAYDSEGWFRTGDEGYYDENGEIVICGRLKEVIRFRHTDCLPLYIEKLLMSHPDIMDAVVVGIDHEIDIERPVAFVKTKPGSNVTEEDIIKLTCELEYEDTFKDSVIFIDELPRSTNGKVKRRVLKERAQKFYESRQTSNGQ